MVQVSDGRQVRAGEGVGADHRRGLRRFGIRGRIDDRHAGRAGLAGHRIARRGLAVQRQAQDLAQRLVGILGRRHALPVADGQEQVLAVRGKGDCGAELAALAALAVAPDHLQVFQARRVSSQRQPGPGQRQAGAALARLGIGQVDDVVLGVVGREVDAQHAALALEATAGTLATGVLAPCGVTSRRPPVFSVISMRPVRQEGDAPGQAEGRHLGHVERQARLGLLLARVDLRIGMGRRQSRELNPRSNIVPRSLIVSFRLFPLSFWIG